MNTTIDCPVNYELTGQYLKRSKSAYKDIKLSDFCQDILVLNEFKLADVLISYSCETGKNPAGLSEVHVADYFAKVFAGLVYFVPELNQFYILQNGRYVPDNNRVTQKFMKAAILTCSELSTQFLKMATATKISGLLELTKSCTVLQKSINEFDVNNEHINTPNGVYDLRTLNKTTEEFCVLQTGIAPDFEQETPIFDKFLLEISNNDEQLADYLLQRLAYCLVAGNAEQTFSLFFGSGANGKSTLLGLLQFILGSYATAIQPELLVFDKTAHARPSPELLALRAKRLIVCSETAQGSALNLQRIKALTGGDKITTRPLFSNNVFEFSITGQIVLQSNHLPVLNNVDYAIRRRVRLVPFSAVFDEKRRDEKLLDKLKGEAQGILAKLMKYTSKYLQAGKLSECDTVIRASNQYADDEDKIGAFLKNCTVTGNGLRVAIKELFIAYQAFCEQTGETPFSQNRFGRTLTERGFPVSSDRRYRLGLTLSEYRQDSDKPSTIDTAPAIESNTFITTETGKKQEDDNSGISRRCMNCELVKSCKFSAQRHGEACEGYQATTKIPERIIPEGASCNTCKYKKDCPANLINDRTVDKCACYEATQDDEDLFNSLFGEPAKKKPLSASEIVTSVFGDTIVSVEPLCKTCYHKTACRDALEGLAQCDRYDDVFQHKKRVREQVTKTLAKREEAQNKIEQLF